jgi:flavin reductase (DIM6/NTAB) family NADH-FMN oxidoreductase RutF
VVLHLLLDGQANPPRLFGEETGDLVDKFASVDWRLGSTGAPLLVDAAVSMEGRTLGHFSVGDHEAFLMRGVRSVAGGRPGLLTYRSTPPLTPGHPA